MSTAVVVVVVPRGRLQAHFRELARPSPRTPLPALGSQRNLPSPSPADATGISRPQNGVEEVGPICRRRPPVTSAVISVSEEEVRLVHMYYDSHSEQGMGLDPGTGKKPQTFLAAGEHELQGPNRNSLRRGYGKS